MLASEQTEAALKAEAAAAAQSGSVAQASAARTFAANTKKAMSYQKVNTAMMPMTFLVPMLFDGEKQMAAMTGVLAVTLTMQLVPALFAVEKQAEKTGAKVAFASGGLSILLAGVIAVGAAFAATKLDIFKDPLDDLTALNSGLEDLETNIASIMSKQGAVMPGVIDATYGELAQDTGLLTSATSDLEAHLSGLESTKSSVGNNDALKNSLEKEIAATRQAIKNIEDLNAAIIMNERIKSGVAQAEAGFETGFFMRTRKLAEEIDGEIIALEDNEKTSFLNRLDSERLLYRIHEP